MPMLNVRARVGRKAYYEGKLIPQDRFMSVPDIPYIRRLLNHWEDIEIEGDQLEPHKKIGTASRQNFPRPDFSVT